MVMGNRKVVLSLEVVQVHGVMNLIAALFTRSFVNFSGQARKAITTKSGRSSVHLRVQAAHSTAELQPLLSQTGEPCSSCFLLVISFAGVTAYERVHLATITLFKAFLRHAVFST